MASSHFQERIHCEKADRSSQRGRDREPRRGAGGELEASTTVVKCVQQHLP